MYPVYAETHPGASVGVELLTLTTVAWQFLLIRMLSSWCQKGGAIMSQLVTILISSMFCVYVSLGQLKPYRHSLLMSP